MGKNRYLWQDIRDAKQAWNELVKPFVPVLERVLDWLLALLNRLK